MGTWETMDRCRQRKWQLQPQGTLYPGDCPEEELGASVLWLFSWVKPWRRAPEPEKQPAGTVWVSLPLPCPGWWSLAWRLGSTPVPLVGASSDCMGWRVCQLRALWGVGRRWGERTVCNLSRTSFFFTNTSSYYMRHFDSECFTNVNSFHFHWPWRWWVCYYLHFTEEETEAQKA